ncbi:MAG: transposase [Solirubrobacteraceae bacterium]
MDDVREWAKRPIEDPHPVSFLDALVLKIREGGSVQRRACYLALGITVDGDRDVLGSRPQDRRSLRHPPLARQDRLGDHAIRRHPARADGARTIRSLPMGIVRDTLTGFVKAIFRGPRVEGLVPWGS